MDVGDEFEEGLAALLARLEFATLDELHRTRLQLERSIDAVDADRAAIPLLEVLGDLLQVAAARRESAIDVGLRRFLE